MQILHEPFADHLLSLQRMNALRIEADDSAAKVDELAAKVKTLEQENLSKEQEITSLQHKNQMLESEVEKLEGMHKDAKAAADESPQHGTQNESLTRRLQLLEEEAEENDKVLRETNEKYVHHHRASSTSPCLFMCHEEHSGIKGLRVGNANA